MNAELIERFGWVLLNFVWQGALIAALAASALLLMRRAAPQQRYLVLCLALLSCLLWPLADAWRGTHYTRGTVISIFSTNEGTLINVIKPAVQAEVERHLPTLVAAWAAFAGMLSLRMLTGMLWLQRLQNRAADQVSQLWERRAKALAPQLGIRRTVRLRVLAELQSPVTAGWLRPIVLLPLALVNHMPADLLESLLVHELAHVRRHDYLINLLQHVIESLLFYHPAVWWLSRRLRIERELIADDIAARQLGEPRRLAQALSELEKIQFHHPLTVAAHGGELMQRIKRLMRPNHTGASWSAALPALILATACVGAFAHAQTTPVQEPAEDKYVQALVNFKSCAKPVWPAEALKQGRTGTVTTEFVVDKDGKVLGAQVQKSSGHRDLDLAALTGIRQCQFIPATLNGTAVQSTAKVMYVWTLK